MSASSDKATARAPKRWWKRWLQNLALAFVTFVICGVLLEMALRIAGYGDLEIYASDPKLYWKLKPNQDCYTKIDHRPVHVNSYGTRGPEFQKDKPPNTIRILSLGDSRTFGWGLSDEETYSRLIERSLQEYVGSLKRVEVINAGVNAWSYPQITVYFRDFATDYKPDYLILGEANLWTQFSEKNSPEFVKKFVSRVKLKNFLRRFATYHFIIEVQLQEFYQRHRTKFIPVDPGQDTLFREQQQSDPDAVFRTAIEELCNVAQKNGTKPVLLYLPTAIELTATNASAVLKVKDKISRQLEVPLLNVTESLKQGGKTLYLDADPVHLNARGNEIVARRLFETMTNLVAP